MSNFYHIKRCLEAQIDIRAEVKMNIWNFCGLFIYYAILNGYLISSSIFRKEYKVDSFLNKYARAACVLLFFFAEFKNYSAHNTLRKLKIQNKAEIKFKI